MSDTVLIDKKKIQAKVAAVLENYTTPIKAAKTNKKTTEEIAFLEGVQVPSFQQTLRDYAAFPLQAKSLEILQINLGYLCNQVCTHCHVNAGPARKELMSESVMKACLNAIDIGRFTTVDLTGGAPEIHPKFQWFVEEISKRNVKVIVRSNLTIFSFSDAYAYLPEFFKKHRVEVIASLPCYTLENVDKQRGEGVFDASIKGLQLLNEQGYGITDGLNLHLVYNPGGAFLPGSQEGLERDYKKMLFDNFNIVFNSLYTITNMPISRFLNDLKKEGKVASYMNLLVTNFNLAAVENVMCTNTLSVKWDGSLYDCDFNQMLNLPVEATAPQHIADFTTVRLQNRNVVLKKHCYGCTAGAGSSCQGAIS